MELIKIWETMIRRRRSIATIFFGFFIAVYLFTQWVPPTYESSAIILVRESNGANAILAALGFASSNPGTEDFDADTEIAMGLIEPILDTAIKQMNLVDRSGKTMTVRKLVKGGLLNNFSPQPFVEVEQIEESSMLEIIGSSGDSNQSSGLANLLANLYISKQIELNQQDFETALTFVGGQMNAVQQDFYNTLHIYRDFMAKTGAIDLDAQVDDLLTKIATLETVSEDNRTMQQALAEEMEKTDEHLARIPMERSPNDKHPNAEQINSLKNTLHTLLQDAAALRIGNTKASSEYRKLVAQVDAVQESISREADAIFAAHGATLSIFEDLTKRHVDLTIDFAVNEAKGKVIDQILAGYQSQIKDITERITKRSKLKAELDVSEGLYTRLLEAQKRLSLAKEMVNASYVLVQKAKPSDRPEFPVAIINYILGIVLGGFWAFGFAFLEEYVDGSIQSPSDLKALWPLPFLGLLSEVRRSGQTRSIGRISDNPLRLERMRRIRNRLTETRNGALPKSLSVTSAASGEGKSYLISNLAAILANEGLRVIAVDMNLRAPALANIFGVPQGGGMGGYLDGTASLDGLIFSTNIERLDLLPAGKPPADPTVYLVSRQLPNLIEALQRNYDVVLIDTPALRDYEDAVSISGLTEANIFVVAAGKTPSPHANEAVERMQLAGRAITGTVMNRMDPLQYKQLR